jgi:hypothetical protein
MSKPRRQAICFGLVLAVLPGLSGCTEALEVPDPPAMSDLALQYDHPTGNLGPQSAAPFVDGFLRKRERLTKIDDLRAATDTLGEFVSSTSRGEDGGVEINGIPIKTDAVITVSGDCPGWSGNADSHGAVSMQVVVRQSRIVPVAWGRLQDCRSEVRRDGQLTALALTGDISVYIPGVTAADGTTSYLVDYAFDSASYGDESLDGWAGSFRLVGDVVEVLLDNGQDGTVVGYGGPNPGQVGVRAANGDWLCTPQERRCESKRPPGSSFSY